MRNIFLAFALSAFVFGATGCKVDDDAADKAGTAAKGAMDTTKNAVSNTAMTGKILGAWNSANALKIENADVDTVGKNIILRGYVETSDMKDTAERIAKDQAGADYTIDNQISVQPPK